MDPLFNHKPPRLGQWLLKQVCPSAMYEDVEGDLEELHQKRVQEGKGRWIAGMHYVYDVMGTSRLRSIQIRRQFNLNYEKDHLAMFNNYFKIALRSIQKHKGYHFLNIGGLAVGLASFLMIALFVHYELSYDNWMEDTDQMYRIPMEISGDNGARKFSLVSAPVAPALKNDFSQVEEALRLWRRSTRLVELEDGQKFYEENVYYADSTFFEFFDLEMINGNQGAALNRPNTIVLSEAAATRFFGQIGKAVGKTITVNDTEYEITGVMENTPGNTHHEFNMVQSWVTIESWEALENWHLTMFSTYVKLNKESDKDAFAAEIEHLANIYVPDQMDGNQDYAYFLEPVKDIHLLSSFGNGSRPGGSITMVYVFSIIGFLILFIAGLNFINLSTARSEMRAKEVGMRKVIGANRSSLIGQFLGEAFVLSMFSFVLALIIFYFTFPWYNDLVGLPYDASVILSPLILIGMVLLATGAGLLAGFYPAIILSSFNPLSMFKSRGGTQNRGAKLRKVLVVGQFTVSVILIVSTITVFKQLDHMMVKDLGFNKEQMLTLPIRGDFDAETQYEPIKSVFGNLASIEGVTLSSSTPGRGVDNFATWLPREENDMMQSMYYLFVDYDFAKTYELNIIEGRDFDASYSTDAGEAFLINEETIASFGWASAEEAIGERIQSGAGGFIGEVVGVFENFHYQSVDQEVEPIVLNVRPERYAGITLKVKADNIPQTLEEVETAWVSLFPDKPFEYDFLDESFNSQYNNFTRMGNIVLTFSILAILIACLGLYGLAAFSAERRIREIGIRKVFGATVSSLTATVSLDFLKLVLVSTFIGLPVAWWLVSQWLNQFAYKIQPDVNMFLISALIAFTIALATVSHQSIKAALANPTDSLRGE